MNGGGDGRAFAIRAAGGCLSIGIPGELGDSARIRLTAAQCFTEGRKTFRMNWRLFEDLGAWCHTIDPMVQTSACQPCPRKSCYKEKRDGAVPGRGLEPHSGLPPSPEPDRQVHRARASRTPSDVGRALLGQGRWLEGLVSLGPHVVPASFPRCGDNVPRALRAPPGANQTRRSPGLFVPSTSDPTRPGCSQASTRRVRPTFTLRPPPVPPWTHIKTLRVCN